MRFAFRLAGHLGVTVGWLLANMTAAEFRHWMAFAALEPFGGPHEDYRAAVGAILPAQAMSGVRVSPATLFPSLAAGDADPAAGRKSMGRGFRMFAVANCPGLGAAIDPKQSRATA